MSLQELRYSDPSPAIDWHQGMESKRPVSSFELVNFAHVVPVAVVPVWRVSVEEQLRDLLHLEAGWDGFNSGPISLPTAAFVRSVLRSVMKQQTPPPALVPAHGGGVQLEWHEQGLDIELMIYRPVDAEMTVHFVDGRDSIEEQQLTTNFEILSRVLEELI